MFVEQEPPFKEVPAMEAAEIDCRSQIILKLGLVGAISAMTRTAGRDL
jgi:hypothetical protein